MRRFIFLIFGLLLSALAHAAIDPYDFDTDAQRERYRHFIEDMRCPKCQNQNLAGSDAPIAQDLRHELHRLLIEGKDDRQIVDYMVSRYGEFILYNPPFDKKTAILWLAPLGFIVIGGAVLAVVIRRRAKLNTVDAPALSPAEQQRINALLNEAPRASGRKLAKNLGKELGQESGEQRS
ncbi:MAG: ccmH [Verrucomicrobiaceae bacterium]|nr:ccmH [Verrucomicrobiaceae bacterium]